MFLAGGDGPPSRHLLFAKLTLALTLTLHPHPRPHPRPYPQVKDEATVASIIKRSGRWEKAPRGPPVNVLHEWLGGRSGSSVQVRLVQHGSNGSNGC